MKLKWEWEIIQNIIKWTLVEIKEDDEKKVIGTVISTQIWDGYWDVEAICSEIGYNHFLENINKQNIKNIVSDHKNFIQEGVEKKRAKVLIGK